VLRRPVEIIGNNPAIMAATVIIVVATMATVDTIAVPAASGAGPFKTACASRIVEISALNK
jgi:hypothetical protein